LKHAHVIRHLASIKSGGKKAYSIFPWTDGGTLQDFWTTALKPLSEDHLLWAFQQMRGLSSAIQTLHEVFKCRHGDLKPQNILCFEKDGETTFKVADFGISKIHDMPTIYRKVATTNLAFTASYQGPEIEFERVDPNDQQPRSRKYDIWSLGCVFLEFVVWLLHGPETMAGFEIARQTSGSSLYEVTDRDRKKAKLHHLAHGTVDALRSDPRCTGKTGLAELLDIIGNRMLKTEVSDRASAEEITKALSDIIDRYREGSLSLFTPYAGPDVPQLRFDRLRS
jgi:serine/threonine protein kinase